MKYLRLDGGETSLILKCEIGHPPRVLHWGGRLPPEIELDQLAVLERRQGGIGNANISIEDSLTLEAGIGLVAGPLGWAMHRQGKSWSPIFALNDVQTSEQQIRLTCSDPNCEVELLHKIEMDASTGMLSVSTAIRNLGDEVLELLNPSGVFFPIPRHITDVISFSGRWAFEFQMERLRRPTGTWMKENRHGRTSHASFPGMYLCDTDCNETHGEAYGIHLAWSGNHRTRVDTLPDGRVFANVSLVALPGELRIAAGNRFVTPTIKAVYSAKGFNGVSQKFHDHLCKKVLPRSAAKPRLVHYNCWEGIYFDHNVDQLKRIASRAAQLGVERFVLDDGWFGSRRNERSGLGDWTVAKSVYPDGLQPLVDHVIAEGMEMGIWFEPEMVNHDSDIFRDHPDWILQVENIDQVPFRHQYALDISRPEVSQHLFEKIDRILSEYPINYVKWDMNRDLHHPGGKTGQPVAINQVHALYELIGRIQAAHPSVEIESCSSGGARIDFGILQRTSRAWTSDSNDAIDRQKIQRGASYFFPLSVLGAHAGPQKCHITGRVLPIQMRAATAMIGHMGVEMNLLAEPTNELDQLKEMISLYKRHRALIHSGLFYRLDFHSSFNAVAVIDQNQDEAIYWVTQLESTPETLPPRFRFTGLEDTKSYQVQLLSPQNLNNSTYPSALDDVLKSGISEPISGRVLTNFGLQLPNCFPATALIFHLSTQSATRQPS